MKVKYGSFEFEPWECDLSVANDYERSPRGLQMWRNMRMTFSIEVCESTQADIITRLGQIHNGFIAPGVGCGLLDDSNNPVVGHWIDNTSVNPNNITGIQIVSSRFPETKNGEFVSGRVAEITVAAMFLEPGSQIFEYKDSLKRIGNAGPDWEWRLDKDRGWFPEKTSPATLQRMIQEGWAIGVDNYLLPPAPLYAVPFEQNNMREVDFIGPDAFPEGFAKYVTKWRYTYLLPTFDDTSRPTIALSGYGN
jgi:hypothetical protein